MINISKIFFTILTLVLGNVVTNLYANNELLVSPNLQNETNYKNLFSQRGELTDTVYNYLVKEIKPFADNGDIEAAQILLPYINPRKDIKYATKIHTIAFADLANDPIIETAYWLNTYNPIYAAEWSYARIMEGYNNPRLYTLIARTFDNNENWQNKEIGRKATILDAKNGNAESLFTIASMLINTKEYDQAIEILEKLIIASSCSDGYDTYLDECAYYTAPMELTAHHWALEFNLNIAWSDSIVPIYQNKEIWKPEGEPLLRVKANTMLGYTHLVLGNTTKALNHLGKAAAWDFNVAMKFYKINFFTMPNESLSLLKIAADRGSKECAQALAMEYAHGNNIKGNPQLALKYAKLGMDINDKSGLSEFIMGLALFYNGRKTEAREYMKKSANKNWEPAKIFLKDITFK